jgi:hypothetical protein
MRSYRKKIKVTAPGMKCAKKPGTKGTYHVICRPFKKRKARK